MKNKNLIIQLLQADLKHQQLIKNLEHIQLQTDGYHYLNLMEVVAQLMGVPKDVPEQWFKVYDHFMENVPLQPVEQEGVSLLPVARECYKVLRKSGAVEKFLVQELG